jgi:hypothetical protein
VGACGVWRVAYGTHETKVLLVTVRAFLHSAFDVLRHATRIKSL